jgi:hypothetical protein
MENSDPKTPLLEASRSGRRGGKLSRRYSVTSLRNDFITKLPDKVRSGLDPESPLDLDLSRVSGLTKGLSLSLSLSLSLFYVFGLLEKNKKKMVYICICMCVCMHVCIYAGQTSINVLFVFFHLRRFVVISV